MEYSQTPDWKLIASQEHEQRKKIELQMENNIDALHAAQQALKTATGYNQFLESKFNDSEAKCASQAIKLRQAITMLQKAKVLVAKRKQEMHLLRDANAKLQAALASKTELLQAEMLAHEKTRYQLSIAATSAAAASAAMSLPMAKSITPSDSQAIASDSLEQYFAHKILSNAPGAQPDSQPGSNYERSLQSDTDFMAQLLYIDKQFKQSQA